MSENNINNDLSKACYNSEWNIVRLVFEGLFKRLNGPDAPETSKSANCTEYLKESFFLNGQNNLYVTKIAYECEKELNRRAKTDQCIIIIYSCLFTSIKAIPNEKNGAIYLFVAVRNSH